ncbi:MAG: sigma-54 interaction domain-containing protein [Planctomycetota bacterium]
MTQPPDSPRSPLPADPATSTHTRDPEPIVSVIGTSGCTAAMKAVGIRVRAWRTLGAALAERHHLGVRLIVVQPGVGGHHGLESAIRTLRKELPLTDVILWATEPTPEVVRAAFRGGVRDAIFGSARELATSVRTTIDQQLILPQLERFHRKGRKTRFERLVSRSNAMWDIFDLCVRVAPSPATVLILGETGTGKELVARAIHRLSGRKGRLVSINAGAVPESLIDSELFGHVKGAFTGASNDKAGLFRRANGGTLFLDEIGNIPLSAQYRLLRVLQEGAMRPVGGDEDIKVDVRLLAATNASLEDEIEAGRFREDLFYRLDVMRFEIPALRERREDILLLFGHFSERFARAYRTNRPTATDSFVRSLMEHSWPGNVRELENLTEKLTLTHAGRRVTAADFKALVGSREAGGADARKPLATAGRSDGEHASTIGEADASGDAHLDASAAGRASAMPEWMDLPLDDATTAFEHAYLEHHLARARGRIGATAASIGKNRRTLLRKLTRQGIDKARFRDA